MVDSLLENLLICLKNCYDRYEMEEITREMFMSTKKCLN